MELVDCVIYLPREYSLGEERLRKLQGSLHYRALQRQTKKKHKEVKIQLFLTCYVNPKPFKVLLKNSDGPSVCVYKLQS